MATYDAGKCKHDQVAVLLVEVKDAGRSVSQLELGVGEPDCQVDLGSLVAQPGDFDFDGYEDLSVFAGRTGPYGTDAYDVYLYRPGSQRFEPAPQLSELSQLYMGLPRIDAKRKRLIASGKSGCCLFGTTEFSVKNGEPLEERRETVTFIPDEGESCRVETEVEIRGHSSKSSRPCTAAERE